MLRYLQWIVLTVLTGSPLGSLLILIVVWLLVDRVTLGILPDPFRFLMRWRREWRLNAQLGANPHDQRARLELAELLVTRGAFSRAVEVLRPRVEADDPDLTTVFVMGEACLGAGFTGQGEKLLAHVQEEAPAFRVGETELVLGRFRLQRGDFSGARQALERLVALRHGTIEGRVLLSRALLGLGDDGSAALMRDAAWQEYVSAPRFQRRKERLWAWRARPSRPALYLALLLVVGGLLGRFVAPEVTRWASRQQSHGGQYVDPTLIDPGDDTE